MARLPSSGRARAALALLVVLVVLLVFVAAPRVRDGERALTGFWAGDPAFLAQAGLSELNLYVAPPEKAGGRVRRQGYLVMVDAAGGLVSNQGVELAYARAAPGRWWSALRGHLAPAPYRVPRLGVAYDDEDVMPGRLRLALDRAEGTLALSDGEQLYAFLVRDNETSMAANAEYARDAEEAA